MSVTEKQLTEKQLTKQRNELNKQLEKIRVDKRLKDNSKKVGRYFTHENTYGSSYDDNADTWDVYTKVTGIDSHGELLATEFQKTSNNEYKIVVNNVLWIDDLGTEINEEEFLEAFGKMMNELAAIKDGG